VLADEINRTPPKTQAALLEAMQEREVRWARRRHRLPDPFFTIATQNPIEQEGTYPLPEAQLDRFMFNIKVGLPVVREEEFRSSADDGGRWRSPRCGRCSPRPDIVNIQKLVGEVPVSEYLVRYVAGDRAGRRGPKDALACRSTSPTQSTGAPGRGRGSS
jgi:MoxR-like ATPase